MSGSLSRFPARLPSGLPQTGAAPAQAKRLESINLKNQITPKKIAVPAYSTGVFPVKASQKTALKPQKSPLLSPPDFSAARARLLAKLAAGGIQDAAVLAAFSAVDRHRFVDSALAAQAYEDTSLPIGLSQTISKPNVVARMLELLRSGCQKDAQGRLGRVLEIGSGCGYQAALLAQFCSQVYSVERLRGLYEKAIENIRHLAAPNLHLILGDGMLGYSKGAPYAGIIAAAGGEAIPRAWVDQLAIGGRIVAPMALNPGEAQALVIVDKTPQGISQTVLESVLFVPLKSGVV